MLKVTFNNISVISWQSVLLVEETGVPGENHRPVASHRQILSHIVVSSVSTHRYNYSERVVRYCCAGRVNYTNCSYNYA